MILVFLFAHELQKLHRLVIFLLFISNSKNKCYLLSLFPQNCRNRAAFYLDTKYFFTCCTLSVGRTTDRFLSACLLFCKTLTLLVHQNFKLFQANIVSDFFPSIRILLNHEVCHCSYTFIDAHGFQAVFSFSSSYSWASLSWSFPLSLQTSPKNPLRVFGKEEFHG